MKKNSGSVGVGFCIVFIVILVIALVGVIYFGLIKEEKKDAIPTQDLVTLYYEATEDRANLFFGYIEDGYLYYVKDEQEADGRVDGAFDFITIYMAKSDSKEGMKKYTKVNHIKRIKTYPMGTDVNMVPFLITEDGKVYTINFYAQDDIEVEPYEVLEEYQVEDILSHTGESQQTFEILLKDGSKKTITFGEE